MCGPPGVVLPQLLDRFSLLPNKHLHVIVEKSGREIGVGSSFA
jgi:hypothetical protein